MTNDIDVQKRQKVYIQGWLRTYTIFTPSHQKRLAANIVIEEWSPVSRRYRDANEIELSGHVATNIIECQEFSLFRMATHIINR